MKDLPVDRVAPRQRLTEALDEIDAVPVNRADNLDAVESKLFGIGSESYVVGSHEYYLGYAIARKKLLTLDTATSIPRRRSSTRFRPSLPSWTRSFCTSAAASAGTATTW